MGELVTVVVGAVVGGAAGWLTSVLAFRRERRAKGRDDAAAAIRRAMTALGALRSLYQDAALASWRKGPADRELAARENDFLSACDQAADEHLADAAHAYLRVGRAYASGDEDTGSVAEERARDELSALMRALVRDARSS